MAILRAGPPAEAYWSKGETGSWHAFEGGATESECALISDGPLAQVRTTTPPKDDAVCGHCERHRGIRRYRTYKDAVREQIERLRELIYELEEKLES